jgi:hypothetical protein
MYFKAQKSDKRNQTATNAFTVASDILIFALPLPLLWSLKKTTKQDKYAVLAAFGVGFVSTIVAGVRLYSIRVYTLSAEPVREAAPINLWSFIEVNLGMLCASGPGKILYLLDRRIS